MNAAVFEQPASPAFRLVQFLKKELAPAPGRAEAVIRLLLSSALAIVCSMTFQVPFLGLSWIVVFLTAQENNVLTRLSGAALLIGATIAISLAIVLLKLTVNDPMLRILGACAIAFGGLYFMRISRLGVMGFEVALIVFYSQSFADWTESPEAIVRALLWVWVAVSYPIALTIIVDFLLLPARPSRLLAREMQRQLREVCEQLAGRRQGRDIPSLGLDAVERSIQTLHRHLGFATRAEAAVDQDRSRILMRVAAVDRLHAAAARLAQVSPGTLTDPQRERMRQLEEACFALQSAVDRRDRVHAPDLAAANGPTSGPPGKLDHVLQEMAQAVQAFAAEDRLPAPEPARRSEGLLSPDAFTSSAYLQFATKTVLAAAICYMFYTAVQWPGIHTATLTCFILALPSLGAITHKGLNRVIGCALGSAVALFATVFFTPHLENITGLLLMSLPVFAIAGWIAAGSPKTNYIGVQIGFAYALALLGQFGPTTDLTEIRDRMVGILIGVAVYVSISTWLWPEREGAELHASMARLLRGIADLARAPSGRLDEARLKAWSLLTGSRDLHSRVALEPGWQHARESVTANMTAFLATAQETLFAVNWFQTKSIDQSARLPEPAAGALTEFKDKAAAVLENLASQPPEQAAGAVRALSQATERLEQCCNQARSCSDIPGASVGSLTAAARRAYECIGRLHGRLVLQPVTG